MFKDILYKEKVIRIRGVSGECFGEGGRHLGVSLEGKRGSLEGSGTFRGNGESLGGVYSRRDF